VFSLFITLSLITSLINNTQCITFLQFIKYIRHNRDRNPQRVVFWIDYITSEQIRHHSLYIWCSWYLINVLKLRDISYLDIALWNRNRVSRSMFSLTLCQFDYFYKLPSTTTRKEESATSQWQILICKILTMGFLISMRIFISSRAWNYQAQIIRAPSMHRQHSRRRILEKYQITGLYCPNTKALGFDRFYSLTFHLIKIFINWSLLS
jgi:hypothetical protein